MTCTIRGGEGGRGSCADIEEYYTCTGPLSLHVVE